MMRSFWMAGWALVLCLASRHPALACSLCQGGPQSQTLRLEAGRAKLVLYGTLANPRLNAATETGTVELHIDKVLKSDPFLNGKKTIELQRYVPVDPKDPPKFLVFCDVYKDKGKEQLDAYTGLPVKSAAVAEYLEGLLALDPKDRTKTLLYCFKYLDHPDPMVGNDAFLEFVKANDQEIGQVAGKLSAAKLRGWLQDSKTPAVRLGLYAFLLGACGDDKDASLLRSMLQEPTERTSNAIDGLLGGYIHLRPREGWELAVAMLRNERKSFTERYAVLRTLAFYHTWKPDDTRREVLRGLAVTLDQGDIADMAIENLRRWQMWDLTQEVLAQYGKTSHDAPIMRRAIVRYALSCPRPEAVRFAAEVRKQDAELVQDVEEALQFEKK
jgi:hypothetical protein